MRMEWGQRENGKMKEYLGTRNEMGTEKVRENRLQSTSHFASRARAIIPAASGAEALVPVWRCVQIP